MTAYNEEPAFLAGLMLGYDVAVDIDREINSIKYEMLYEDARHLREVSDRLRAQIISIVTGLRRWRGRHEDLHNALMRRYSTYEGLLIRQDLRQHWLLYRHAQREFHHLHGACIERMGRLPDRYHARPSGKRAA